MADSRNRIKAAILALALVTTAAACGNDDNKEVAPPADETTTSSVAPEEDRPSDGDDAEQAEEVRQQDVPNVTAEARGTETAYLTNVTVENLGDGGEVVTFSFRGPLPGYDIGYATLPPRQDGSGNPVEVAGNAGVALRFTGASAVNLTGGVNRTYTGENRIQPSDTGNITEVVGVSDYEAQLVWAVGLERVVRFSVEPSSNPSQLVIRFG